MPPKSQSPLAEGMEEEEAVVEDEKEAGEEEEEQAEEGDVSGGVAESAVQKPTQRNKEAPKYDLSHGLSRSAKNPRLHFRPPSKAVASRDSAAVFASSTTADEVLKDIDGSAELEDDEAPAAEDSSIDDIPSVAPPANPRPPPSRGLKRIDAAATITIGSRPSVTSGTEPSDPPRKKRRVVSPRMEGQPRPRAFVSSLSEFLAPGVGPLDENQYSGGESASTPRVSEDDDSGGSQDSAVDGQPTEGEDDVLLEDDGGVAQQKAFDEQEEGPALFLPGADIDDRSEDGSDEEEDGKPASPEQQQAEDEGDGEYIPEAPTAAEQRATARAARLLKEAETSETSQPSSQLLERNLWLFKDSRTIATTALVRFERTSLEKIRESADQCRKASIAGSAAAVAAATTTTTTTAGSGSQELLGSQDEGAAAEQRLTLTVTKQDFLDMKIHGQFNKGFILASQDNELFIIDQHASDEKYNFETLQATTVVQNQPLVIPQTLDLMAMDEIAVMDNLDVLKRNGFVVEVDLEQPTGCRCKLISLPMSKETVFGVEGCSFVRPETDYSR